MKLENIDEGSDLYLRIVTAEMPPPGTIESDKQPVEVESTVRAERVYVETVEPDAVTVIRDPLGDHERCAVNPNSLYLTRDQATWGREN